ncbi:calmodulin-regulated spectrin-associated protein 3 isoform X2 [Paramormyrops kingsleyae]|uniref:calmodulin-regulated spectrin-associated protein 3 isoform X2 n=1 Tax=Paramormyrops kingsleyae TaxID=1676925 RepID=UPI003B96C1D3
MVDSGAMRKTFTVPEIKPLDQYDFKRAKICASLAWLLSKCYGGGENVPAELRDPFYLDQYEQEHVKPPVTGLLLSTELYCRAYGLLLRVSPPKDCTTVLQLMAQNGVVPRDEDAALTESQLRLAPIRMSAHLALIDALMSVDAIATVSKVKMPAVVEQLWGRASWENGVLYWINRLIQKLRENTEGDTIQRPQPSTDLQPVQPSCPTRWYWKLVPHAIAFCLKESGNKPPVIRYRKDKILPKQTPTFPLVTSIRDLSNGCAMATVVHYYCPSLLPLEDVCLKDTMSVADSLYNLQLVRDFCNTCLQSCCPLTVEDLLYTSPALRVNIMSFMAELLGWFEVRKPDFVRPLELLDLSDPSGLIDCTTPPSGSSSSASPTFIFKQPLVVKSSPVSPGATAEGIGRAWAKKQICRPLSAVSFSIPFGLDSDVDVVMGNPVGTMMRSLSSDSLKAGVPAMTRVPYTPPEDLSHLMTGGPGTRHKNGPVDVSSTEEVLQVLHSQGKLERRLCPEGAPDGFYLHSPDEHGGAARLSSSAPSQSSMLYRPRGETQERRNKHSLGKSRKEDSVLCVISIESESSRYPPKARSTPGTPASVSMRKLQSDNGTRMTSFAERKKKLAPDTPPGETPSLQMTSWAQRSDESPSRSQALTSEMSDLGAKLEEKRKSIEAQKQRIEAIFAKHRQRLGNSALMQLQKQQAAGEEGGPVAGQLSTSSGKEESLSRLAPEEQLLQDKGKEETSKPPTPPKLEKQVTFSVETGTNLQKAEEKLVGPVPLGDYSDAVSKLSATLSSLQSDMQRLSEQQKMLMNRQSSPCSRAWVIPASRTLPHRDPPSASPSPSRKAPSASTSPKPTQASHRRARSVPPKCPGHQHQTRPHELKIAPVTRVLTPQRNVDSLQHLRKVSPSQCQVQTCSSFSIGELPSPPLVGDNSSETGSSEDHTIFSLELEDSTALPAGGQELPAGRTGSSGAPSECSMDSDTMGAYNSKHCSLMEISMSSLPERGGEEGPRVSSSSMSSQSEPEMKGGSGLFLKEEETQLEGETQQRAALLDMQQKRADELKRHRQELEREDRTTSRLASLEDPKSCRMEERPVPASCPPPRRGDFTRQEYQRRQQLKLMEELDKVLRSKATSTRAIKKQRPKTEFRDDSGLSRSPAKGFLGSQLNKVYSHSSQNLSSIANDSGNGISSPAVRKSPSQPHSPARLMSPSRLANQNGEKDWENGSMASSPASIPEYTGPKLYKEPSFKSNKFIIHNALSHCCLAGKVNEPQKNKIVEEMEKSSANHFLILFRDSSCQFRAVYTLNPDSEELVRLAGIGPRLVVLSTVDAIYKYNSDRKQFTTIPSKTLSMSVDAFTIPAHLWQSKRPSTPKKPGTPK